MMPKLTEINLTAAHEVGHAIIAQNHGIKVFEVRIEPGGDAGYADIDEYCDTADVAMEISLAGFVNEQLIQGRDPEAEIDRFFEEHAFLDDLADILDVMDHLDAEIVGDGDPGIITELTIQSVLKSVIRQLSKPRVQQQSKRLARRLLRHKRIVF
jgi:hypothetical protein